MWLDFSAFTDISDREITERILRKAKVWLDYGKMFGSLDDFLSEPYMKSHRTGTLMTGRNADKVYKLEVFASMKVSSTEKTVFDMDSAGIAAFIRNSADVQIADKDKRIVALATCSDANTLTKTVVFCYIVE